MAIRARCEHRVRAGLVNIRKFVLGLHSVDELMAAGSLTKQATRFLEASVAGGPEHILVSGGTQVGKPTV